MAVKKFKCHLPDGKTRDVYCEEGADKQQVVNDLLDEWSDFCENNWLDSNHKDKTNGEQQVKRFMACLSEFLLRDAEKSEDYPIMTEWGHRKAKASEVLVPGTPGDSETPIVGISEEDANALSTGGYRRTFLGNSYKTKKRMSQPWIGKFDRLMRYRTADPKCAIESFPIDTENVFTAYGIKYQMSKNVEEYQVKVAKDGEDRYDMDRVIVAKMTDGGVIFLDQNAWEIPASEITVLDGMKAEAALACVHT